MPEKDRQIEFKVGDRIIEEDSSEEGTVVRLCSDKGVVFIRWDGQGQQVMIDTRKLIRIKSRKGRG